ncbi:MAG: acyl-CoA thioesterase [Promethearchaeota archaeon]
MVYRYVLTNIVVRFSETDAFEFVHFSEFFKYFELGFVDLLKKVGLLEKAIKREIGFPIVESHCEYKNPAFFGDELEIHTMVKKIGKHSLTTMHEIYNAKSFKLIAKGWISRVFMRYDNRELIQIPKDTREKLNMYL